MMLRFMLTCPLIYVCVFNLEIIFCMLHYIVVDRGGFFEIFLS